MKKCVVILLWTLVGYSFDFGLKEGLHPLQDPTTLEGTQVLSAKACRKCHETEYQQWSKSRHSAAWTNEVFQDGYKFEPSSRCVYCHAPLKAQAEEIRATKKTGSAIPLASEGVNCIVCHVREGSVVSSKPNHSAFHPYKQVQQMGTSQFCANCHQFSFHEVRDGKMNLTDVPMQNTFREWQNYQAAGGTKSCQNCHMPKGSHDFHGANFPELLLSALQVQVEGRDIILSSKNVGHSFPTGDLFRHLTLEIKTKKDSEYRVIKRFGRRFELKLNEQTGSVSKVLAEDTSLRPNTPVRVMVTEKNGFKYRVVYHYGSEENEARGTLPSELLLRVIAEGEVKGKKL